MFRRSMLSFLSQPIRCWIGWHHWAQMGRPMPWVGGMISLRRCERCGRVDVTRFDEYPEIDPPLPWSEAEARAELLRGTAVMDRPVSKDLRVAFTQPRVLLSVRGVGEDAGSTYQLLEDGQWTSTWSTGARVRTDEPSTFTQTPSDDLLH